MGANSKIEWTDHTWNPWYGCHKVSEGCRNCYMYREMAHYGRDPSHVQRSKTTFRDPLKWAKVARRKGERYKVFVCSWSDFFIEEADPCRDEAWEIIKQTPELTYMILTKRPERLLEELAVVSVNGWITYPFSNIWLGVSVEDQRTADIRIPLLFQVPSVKRFISCEPLLSELLISHWFTSSVNSQLGYTIFGLDWVIVGGESGPNARPCHPDWVRSIRDQCIVAGVPFFFKQWGEYLPLEPALEQRGTLAVEYDRVGRKQAGAMLDGREWRELPGVLA